MLYDLYTRPKVKDIIQFLLAIPFADDVVLFADDSGTMKIVTQ